MIENESFDQSRYCHRSDADLMINFQRENKPVQLHNLKSDKIQIYKKIIVYIGAMYFSQSTCKYKINNLHSSVISFTV